MNHILKAIASKIEAMSSEDCLMAIWILAGGTALVCMAVFKA